MDGFGHLLIEKMKSQPQSPDLNPNREDMGRIKKSFKKYIIVGKN